MPLSVISLSTSFKTERKSEPDCRAVRCIHVEIALFMCFIFSPQGVNLCKDGCHHPSHLHPLWWFPRDMPASYTQPFEEQKYALEYDPTVSHDKFYHLSIRLSNQVSGWVNLIESTVKIKLRLWAKQWRTDAHHETIFNTFIKIAIKSWTIRTIITEKHTRPSKKAKYFLNYWFLHVLYISRFELEYFSIFG